jgi:hypothetical protein
LLSGASSGPNLERRLSSLSARTERIDGSSLAGVVRRRRLRAQHSRLDREIEMQRYTGSCSPRQLHKPQAFHRHAMSRRPGKPARHIIAISALAAALIAILALSTELKVGGDGETDSSRMTVIYKNQVSPTIAEIAARVTPDHEYPVNSDTRLKVRRGGWWI